MYMFKERIQEKIVFVKHLIHKMSLEIWTYTYIYVYSIINDAGALR